MVNASCLFFLLCVLNVFGIILKYGFFVFVYYGVSYTINVWKSVSICSFIGLCFSFFLALQLIIEIGKPIKSRSH